jgi:hypothetical protein
MQPTPMPASSLATSQTCQLRARLSATMLAARISQYVYMATLRPNRLDTNDSDTMPTIWPTDWIEPQPARTGDASTPLPSAVYCVANWATKPLLATMPEFMLGYVCVSKVYNCST